MTNNAQKAVDLLNNPVIYLGIIVAMLGWFIPFMANQVIQSKEMEEEKLNKITAITISTHDLKNSVKNIDERVADLKKNNELIYKSVKSDINIISSDIRLLCSQIKRYGEYHQWTEHPECLSK